jgi:hypothetical protein
VFIGWVWRAHHGIACLMLQAAVDGNGGGCNDDGGRGGDGGSGDGACNVGACALVDCGEQLGSCQCYHC